MIYTENEIKELIEECRAAGFASGEEATTVQAEMFPYANEEELTELASLAEEASRSYSPYEIFARMLNEAEDEEGEDISEELWDAYEEGITQGIEWNLEKNQVPSKELEFVPTKDNVTEDEQNEISEDSITCENLNGPFYYSGKQIASSVQGLRAWMDKAGFFPAIYFISDHGNVNLCRLQS